METIAMVVQRLSKVGITWNNREGLKTDDLSSRFCPGVYFRSTSLACKADSGMREVLLEGGDSSWTSVGCINYVRVLSSYCRKDTTLCSLAYSLSFWSSCPPCAILTLACAEAISTLGRARNCLTRSLSLLGLVLSRRKRKYLQLSFWIIQKFILPGSDSRLSGVWDARKFFAGRSGPERYI